jgi:predicted DNA binding CopG/RHH family protein
MKNETGFSNTKQYSNTDIEKVKQLNAQSGLSYQDAKRLLALKYASDHKEP